MAKAANLTDGARELRQARATGWPLFLSVGVFSAVVNLLMLTGPLFMLQVYDRVLASRSIETLTALFVLVIFLFVLMGAIDIIRNRVMQRIAARFQDRMEGRVFDAALREGALRGDESAATAGGMRDLDSVQRLIGSPVMLAFFDLPWAPLFLAAVFMFHPVLGIVATVGGGILVGTTILNRVPTRAPLQGSAQAGAQAQRMADLYRDEGEVIGALGMRGATFARWRLARSESQDNAVRAGDLSAGFSVFSRTFRLFLQSAMLAAGAWLVLRQELTPGAMIASSIVMGRALAPVDQLVGGWPSVQAAQDGWGRLAGLLSRQPADPVRTPLPRPEARLEVRNLSVAPPGEGQATLRGVSFGVAPGTALGVIGPSGAGKSTLARALIGAWRVGGGSIRLGGATLDQYHPDVLGGLIGYLPQQVTLFDGTIAENIARLSDRPDRPGGARRTGGRRAPDDPGPAAGIRHAHQPDGGPSVGRPDSAHRPGPRALSRPRAAGSGRAELEPGQPGIRGAECRDPAAEVAGRRGHHHGPPSRRDQRMRKPAGAGGRRPPRLRPA